MSGSDEPEASESAVPAEFASTYRTAYERAMATQSAPAVGAHRGPGVAERASQHSPLLVPGLLALLVVLLVLGAYAVGRMFSGSVDDSAANAPKPTLVLPSGEPSTTSSRSPSARPSQQPESPSGPWQGKVAPVEGVAASAGCTSAPGEDADGNTVDYVASNMVDGDPQRTWRCAGDAVGERIVLRLDGPRAIGEVGLVPGYAKTDPSSGDDRYAENNRITQVRWTIGKTVVVQNLDGSAQDRSMRLLRVPRTTARVIELEILSVVRGQRDTTAISEVAIGEVR